MGWRDIWYERETGHLCWWWRVPAYLCMTGLAAIILGVFLLTPLYTLMEPSRQLPESVQYLIQILSYLAILCASVLAGIWASRTFEQLPAYTLGLTKHGSWVRALCTGLGAGMGLMLILAIGLYATGMATISTHVMTTRAWLILVLASVEALVFSGALVILLYGYLFQTLLRGLGLVAALLIMGGLMAAFSMLSYPPHSHVTLIAPANALVLSILLGMLYLRSGALWAPIGLLAGWNLILLLGFSLPSDPSPIMLPISLGAVRSPWLSDPSYGPEGGVAVSIFLLATLAVVTYSRRGLALESRWWEWRQLTIPQEQTLSWDFSIGSRYYQWKLLARERADS